MSRESHRGMIMEGLILPTKIRKRGCSSSSSSSSRIRNHRLNKRAGKTRAGLLIGIAGSRSSTPVPIWRTSPLRSTVDSPKCSQSGRSTQPVSARRLAATLWEIHELPSPKMCERNLEVIKKRSESKMVCSRDKMELVCRLHSGSGYLPRHLSDPSHSPTVSEKMDQSAAGSRHRTPSISQRLKSAEQNTVIFDSTSNKSPVIEIRSHVRTPSGSVTGDRNRLKDITNALTTSKELLKIINRLWARADQPSSSMSVISALHAELERARLQVSHLIDEQHSDQNDVNHLMKRWAEEKASWKVKEQRLVEEAIESVAGELEVERKLRKRLERLNKKLGKELVELKASCAKAIEDLETEKRAREITEQVCSELVKNIDGDKDEARKVRMEPVEVPRYSEEKNSAMGKLRKQLEVFLGTKRDIKDQKSSTHSIKSHLILPGKHDQEDEEEKDDSAGSDVLSIRSDMKDNNKNCRWAHSYGTGHESMKLLLDEIKTRNSISGQASRKSTCRLDGVECISHHRNSGDGYDKVEALRRMGVKDHRISLTEIHSPSQQIDRFVASSKSRLGEVRGEGAGAWRSKR